MNFDLSKTNSWHWLAAAVIVSAVIAGFFWVQRVMPAVQKAREREEQLTFRLQGLRSLNESRIEEAEEREALWKGRRAEATERYNALGIEPLPTSAEAAFALKNRIDAALAARGLRVIANEIAVRGMQSAKPADSSRSYAPAGGPVLPKTWSMKSPYSAEEFRYSVIGSFRNMFLYLWLESARKSSYHLKNFRIAQSPEGVMQMDFVLQVSHK